MKPSVVVIMLDAMRADCAPRAADSAHLRSVGLTAPQLPSFSRLVHGAFGFTQAIACAPYTSAGTASILTGLLPPEHGVRAFSAASLSREVLTLPAILAGQGYATCAMSDRPQVLQPMGLLKDFRTTVASDAEAMAWWDSNAGSPRLLFLHLWDAHKPYGMPVVRTYKQAQPARQRWEERLSAHHITLLDPIAPLDYDQERQLVYRMQYAWEDMLGYKAGLESYVEGLRIFDGGRLRDLVDGLSARAILDESIVVTLADHGEGRDHPPSRRMCHGSSLRDDQLRIPLFIHLPTASHPSTVQPEATIAQQVSQADVLPTILDALGLLDMRTAPRSPYNGRSLLPLLRGQTLSDRPAYAELWTLTHTPHAGDPQFPRDVSPMLRHRMLRWSQRKYHLVGQPGDIGEDALAASAERFVDALFRHALGRFATPDERALWLERARRTPALNRKGRTSLAQSFLAAGEFQLLPKHAMYDLARDPLEERPHDARKDAAAWAEYASVLAEIERIDSAARPGDPLLTNEADEQVILKRLQDLGYLE